MYEAKRPAWLKIDFDHFTFDDSEEEERDAAVSYTQLILQHNAKLTCYIFGL